MAYTAELLSVGTELLLGNILNSDARDLSRELAAMGINVYYHTVVGDNPQRLRAAVSWQGPGRSHHHHHRRPGTHLRRPDQAGAGRSLRPAAGVPPRVRRRHPGLLRQIRSGDDGKQSSAGLAALEGCHILDNPWGTAPGCAFHSGNNDVVMLPGPPRECIPMFREKAAPWAGSAEPGGYPVPYPAHLRAGEPRWRTGFGTG